MKISSIIALLALTLSFGASACWPSVYNYYLSNFVNVADICLVLTYLTVVALFLTLKRKKTRVEYVTYLSLLAISLLIQYMGILSASLDDCSMSIDNSLLTKSNEGDMPGAVKVNVVHRNGFVCWRVDPKDKDWSMTAENPIKEYMRCRDDVTARIRV